MVCHTPILENVPFESITPSSGGSPSALEYLLRRAEAQHLSVGPPQGPDMKVPELGPGMKILSPVPR